MLKTRILIADDELSILIFLRANFESNGFTVIAARDGIEALRKIEMELPDLVLLDINMPGMGGFEVCSRLREWSQIPIIIVSARADESDKVKSLDLGADDYVTKPFGAAELIARVRAVLRRTQIATASPARPSFTSGDLEVNFIKRQTIVHGAEVRLTPTEYNLLQELVLNAGKVLTHAYLLNKVWGPEYQEDTQYLHVFVRRLRAKLEADPANVRYFLTVPGVGYQFRQPS